MAIFSPQNFIKDPPFTRLDLLSCRNLMIYLNADLQKRLLPIFHYALKPGGLLMLGTSKSQPKKKNDGRHKKASRDSLETLEREMRYMKETHQTTLEELETSNEELKSTNEELQSTNKEMQSTNEETGSGNPTVRAGRRSVGHPGTSRIAGRDPAEKYDFRRL